MLYLSNAPLSKYVDLQSGLFSSFLCREIFQIRSKLDSSNLAYTGAKLGLHTDLNFYSYVPNVSDI